jgi:hypothetical protein
MGLSNKTLIVVSIDGASSMVDNESDFVTFLKGEVMNLVGAYCITHNEYLDTSNSSKRIHELVFVDKLESTIYSW